MSVTMQAVVFHGPGQWAVSEFPIPAVQQPDDVLLKVDRAGICGTDLHILAEPPGHPATPGTILGHEYTATVVEAGPSANLHSGDRVVIDPNITCGVCRLCRMGMSNSCENMTTLGIFRHGGLAHYSVAPARALHRIAASVPPDEAALAEPLSCVLHAFEKCGVFPGESVVILGAGPIGLLFLLLSKAAGAGKVIVVESAAYRKKAAEDLGASVVLDPHLHDCPGEVRAVTGLGADVVVEAVGTLFPESVDMVRRGGRIVLFGMNLHGTRGVSQYTITRNEITVFGTYIQKTAFPKVVRLLESRILPLDRLVTHRFRLGEVGGALAALKAGEAVKVLISPW